MDIIKPDNHPIKNYPEVRAYINKVCINWDKEKQGDLLPTAVHTYIHQHGNLIGKAAAYTLTTVRENMKKLGYDVPSAPDQEKLRWKKINKEKIEAMELEALREVQSIEDALKRDAQMENGEIDMDKLLFSHVILYVASTIHQLTVALKSKNENQINKALKTYDNMHQGLIKARIVNNKPSEKLEVSGAAKRLLDSLSVDMTGNRIKNKIK